MEELLRTSSFRLLHQAGSAAETWVTFAGMGGRSPTFPGLIARRGAQAFHVTSEQDDWYQSPELGRALSALPLSGKVVLFGASMGGFGALTFASQFSPDVTIVASPQTYICPHRTRGNDDRYGPIWQAMAGEGRILQSDARRVRGPTCVIYDPMCPEDRWHADRIVGPMVTRVLVRFLGHSYLADLHALEGCDEMMGALISSGLPPQGLVKRLRAARGLRYDYQVNLAQLMMRRRRFSAALTWLTNAATSAPDRQPAHWHSSIALEALGRMDEARDAMERTLAATGHADTRWTLYHRLAHLYSLEGRYPEAEMTFDRGLRELPASAGLHAELARFLLAIPNGDLAKAKAALETACRLAPGDQRHRSAFSAAFPPLRAAA